MKRILPNFITLCNGFFGIISIIAILNDQINIVPYFFAAALLCDFLDGMVARLLKTSSEIGKELDSLSDTVSFGVLPAVLIAYMLSHYETIPNILIFSAGIYPLFTIYRLAKFNIKYNNLPYFVGLSSPLAAIMVIAVFFLNTQWQMSWQLYITINFIIGILMILPIHFYTFKDLQKSNLGKIALAIILLAIIIFFILYSWNAILILLSIYVILALILGYRK